MSLHQIVETTFIPAQLVFAMIGMGATLSLGDFLLVFRSPRELFIGLGLQLVFVPLLALAFISAFGLSKGWAVGIILVAVVPGGAFSNLLTYLGRGNAALSVSVTTVSNVTCIVSIPLLLHLLVSQYVPPEFELPTKQIVSDIFTYLLVPLGVGMAIFRMDQRVAAHASRWSIRASVLLLLCIVVSALSSGRIDIAAYGWGPPLRLVLFGNVLWIAAGQVCRLLKCFDDDNVALTIEVSIRNVALALLLVHFFFPGQPASGHVLYTCLFYAGMGFFIGIPIVARARRDRSPALFWPVRRREPSGAPGVP
jgi:bile acid:Na+ symporter, BASS family